MTRGPRTSGSPCRVPPAATTSLALVLHEWATNAVKHGSLGTTDGRVSVLWTIEEDKLVLTWSESGGPPVGAAAAEGFGSALSRQSIVGQLGGTLSQDFEPAGLIIRMNVPVDRLGR
jgi:two-component sensor histidine kinase